MRCLSLALFLCFMTLAPAQDIPIQVVHAFVALADNEHQGILPVPARIGYDDDPDRNLYWGCSDGVKGLLQQDRSWKLLDVITRPAPGILERRIYKTAP